MNPSNQYLLIEQTDKKLMPFKQLESVIIPEKGWVHTIRKALKMSMRQLGNRLNISAQAIKEIEDRESNESISLKSLKEVGAALDMKLIYGFMPKEGSLNQMIEKRAYEIAVEIVSRTSNTMRLEDQENSKERLRKAIRRRADEIKNKMPKYLWD